MDERKWTDQQRTAIDDRGGTLLLSAAAGSGKTAVLTHRAVNLLADEDKKIPADRLLIVTFTNAAAAELRARMAAALEEKIQNNPGSTWLRKQKILLGKASICTVDSFCMDLLTQHFTRTELPIGFSVLKPAEEASLREQAIAETLEEAYDDPNFCLFSSQYGKARSDVDTEKAILRLFDITCAMPYPTKWWAQLKNKWVPGQRPEQTPWGKEILKNATILLEGIVRRQEQAFELLDGQEKADSALTILRQEIEQSKAMMAAVQKEDWDSCCTHCNGNFETLRLPKGLDGSLATQIKLLRNTAKDKFLDLKKKYFVSDSAAFAAECELCHPMVIALEKAVQHFSQLFWQKKTELGSFCFYDFEHEALKLLVDENGNRTSLSEELGEKYAAVMVDEYQDTNDLQDTLYNALANRDASNLFFVGDVKQSIYGFRDARPEHFIEKKDSFAPYDQTNYPATLLLSNNFRSTAAVIGCINDIFTPIMHRDVGGIEYDVSEKLVPGQECYSLNAPCQVWITDTTPPEKENTKDKKPSVQLVPLDKQKLDDRYTVAQKIAKMLQEGTPVRDENGVRPCRTGDFCILLRSPSSTAQQYVDALGELGIPTFCRTKDALLEDPQVDLLLSFLRVLDNPGQDIPLTAVLLSPLFGFTPQHLVSIRLAYRKGTLYSALLHSDLPMVTDFLTRLRQLRRRSLGLPVQDICGLILDNSGLYELTGAMAGAESSRQNLRLFQSVAAQYAGSNGLSGFLRLIDSAIKNERPLTDQRGQNAPVDRVQIMSIHGSKGLEFPIVILAGADHKFNMSDAWGSFLCHNRLGIAFKRLVSKPEEGTRQLVPTLASAATSLAMQRETVSEEMRLMYVALTRAKDHLILSWSEDKLGETVSSACLAVANGAPDLPELQTVGNCMSHWLLLSFLSHPDSNPLRESLGLPVAPMKLHTNGHFVFEQQSFSKSVALSEAEFVPEQPDPELLDTLRIRLNNPLPVPTALPVKVSVSAISHKETQPVLAMPAFMQKQDKTAAGRGTAMHKFLQLTDLSAACKDLQAELDRLENGAFMAHDEIAVLNKASLTRFLQSDLVARMLSADTLLREYEFIDRIDAGLVDNSLVGTPAETEQVFLLGIADCIILKNGSAELIDYKTDRSKDADGLLSAYSNQLKLYRAAIAKRLGVPVIRTVIYSLFLDCEIEVP